MAFIILFVSQTKGQENIATQLDNAAKEFLAKGMLDSAAHRLEHRALYFKEKPADYISAYVEIADLYIQTGNYLKSRYYLNRVDPHDFNHDDPEIRTSLIEWYLYQGYTSEKMSDYLSAKEYYEEVHLRLVRKADEQPLELGRYLYQPLGNIYTRLGEYENALLFLEKFRQLSLLSDDPSAQAEAYSDLSIVYQTLGQSEEAIALYNEALKISGLSNKSKGLLLSNLGSSLLNVGKADDALTYSNQALSFFDRVNDRELSPQSKTAYEAWTYGVIAKVYFEQADYRKALANIEEALKHGVKAYGHSVSREMAKLYILKGTILLKNNQSEQALQSFQLALTYLFKMFNDGDTDSDPEAAILYAENAIVEALQGKAHAYYQRYLENQDLISLKKAFQVYELIFDAEDRIAEEYDFQRSKLILLNERNERSRRAMDICYILYENSNDTQYLETAFDIMERNKARVLLESQSEIRARKALQVSKSLLEKQQECRQAASYFQKTLLTGGDAHDDSIARESLFQVQKELAIVNKQLEEEYPDYYRLVNSQMKRITIKEVQDRLLKEEEVIVEFFFSDRYLYVIKVSKAQVLLNQVKITDNFFRRANQYLDALRKPSDDLDKIAQQYRVAFELYEQLLQTEMGTRFPQKCIIIPDGVLMYLPFEALITRQSDKDGIDHFLLSETAISYSFSASVLQQSTLLDHVTSSTKSFIGFAPGFRHSNSFNSLMHSQEEIEKIGGLLNGSIYEDEMASKKTFLKEVDQYQIVHLSTHAAVERESPLYSWIAFHDQVTQEEDSFKLFLSEIYNLQLQAELVVLSACETGTGYLAQGEGVMSLARGFAFAGCASTVMTLWQVNDNATSRINQSFYQYLLKGWSKDEALRQAKLDYINSDDVDRAGQHPYFWSSLVLMGDAGAIEFRHQNNLLWVLLGVMVGSTIVFFVIKKRRRRNSAS